MRYRYRAIDQDGRRQRGRLDAQNSAALELRLERLGLILIDAQPLAPTLRLWRRAPVTRSQLIELCFHLEQLLNAGVPLLDSLADLRDSLPQGRLRVLIASLIEDIEGGQPLSHALARHPAVFDRVFVSLIEAGETSGKLPEVLQHLVETLKWQDELAAQTRRLLVYPSLLAAIIGLVLLFLLLWLVPNLASFIRNMGQTLPWNTRLLLSLSELLRSQPHLLALLAASPFAAWGLWRWLDPAYRYKVDRLTLALPYLGPVLQKIMLARFARYFGLMYGAGIAILDSLAVLEGVVGNSALAHSLAQARRDISAGQGLAASFERLRLFPPLVIRMLRVGESTGAIDRALGNVSYFYSRDARESIARLQLLMEPMLTLLLGVLLGTVMLSVLGPIYDLLSQIRY